MDGFSTLRSTQQQLKDAFAESYRQLTDPEEREKAIIKRRRQEYIEELNQDTGL